MRLSTIVALAVGLAAPAGAQDLRQGPPLNVTVRSYDAPRRADAGTDQLFFDPALRPFYHGVASGDPTPDGVVLWTRVTPPTDTELGVRWRVATDLDLGDVVASGTARTDRLLDYTVRVTVTGLDAGTTYYYGFQALGANSITGRTRTAPTEAVDQLRFAVTSCSNYQQGYFVAYRGIAARADLDAVLHLGDYFYEYGAGTYGDAALVDADRAHTPLSETVTLADYRLRHSLYKLDPDLRAAHQQHPWITVWDDHESANDSWEDGAENHNEFLGVDPATDDSLFAAEGTWEDRRTDAAQAYFEWLPLRRTGVDGDSDRIYRRLSYGPLAEVTMIDTRLEGRDRQLASKTDAAAGTVEVDTTRWLDPDRTLLGEAQREWLLDGLASSTAQWKVIGNQVMMTQLAFNPFAAGANAPFTNLDAWDGYPAERERVLTAIRDGGVDNVVVTTGDIHTTWASDLPVRPFGGYDPASGAGSVAVEFVTPSVSAANLNENLGIPPEAVPEDVPTQAEQGLAAAYPQLKTVELDEHGYLVLDLTGARAQADWFYVNDIRQRDSDERFSRAFFTASGENHLQAASGPAPNKADAPALAPAAPPPFVVADEDGPSAEQALLVVGAYPNPASGRAHLAYVLNETRTVRAVLFDAAGREVAVLHDGVQPAGAYALDFETATLAAGVYLVRISDGASVATRAVTVAR
ncbi:alkaline phosphatase D family protein [Rubrivirga sp.]|uniref:alkaline phosphatase D family protein n=1 Tax=Rubrivirga sp. TaxID=1885344 RepID=UPI003B51DE0B